MSIRMKKYIMKVKHDRGTVQLLVTARNREVAVMQATLAERCPKSAIVSIREVK